MGLGIRSRWREKPHPKNGGELHIGLLLQTIGDEMKAAVYSRRLAALLFVAAVLLAALTPATSCLFLVLLVTPLWLLFATTVGVPLGVFDEQIHKPQALAFPVFSPRSPPVL